MVADEVEDKDVQFTLRSLVDIEVEELFGTFTYSLRSKNEASKLLILYGDNGSGKTTILECLYHLLSPATNEGHRTYLTEVQFKRFYVRFTGGWEITVSRESSSKGDYLLAFHEPGSGDPVPSLFSEETKKIAAGEGSEFTGFLRRLNLEIFYLRANRTLKTDSHANARRAERNHLINRSIRVDELGLFEHAVESDEGQSIRRAISRANDYIRLKASRAANAGGASANSIYEDVVKKIVGSSQPLDEFAEPSKDLLELRFQKLAERSKAFARFSLIAPIKSDDILRTIRDAPPSTLPLIASVLDPYLDSVTARLDALNSTQILVESLVEDVNTFFTNKKLRFRLSSGLQIVVPNGTVLSPDLLSSGEKHLLLMFCHTVVAHGKRTLFIIDEPELSLNVKWQHRIVDRLVDLVKDSPMQFIFATHSIELLSDQLDTTVKLIPNILENENA